MTVFRLKQFASDSANAAMGRRALELRPRRTDRGRRRPCIGVLGGLVAATVLIVLTAIYATPFDVGSVSVYVAGLLTMLVLSAT